MYKPILTAVVSYFIAASGLFCGAALARFLPRLKILNRALFSLAGGMAAALVCFEFFPAAVARSGLYFTMAATMFGILMIYFAETKFQTGSYNETFFYLLSCGVAAGLFLNSGNVRLSIPVIIAGSCLPFGIGGNLLLPFRAALIMAAGGLTGALISYMPLPLPPAVLSVSAGVILYISTGAVESRADRRFAVKESLLWAATIAGFIFAVILMQ